MIGTCNRGYSLLVVLLVLVAVAVVGLTGVTMATLDEGTALARVKRAQALLAAEAGLAIYSGVAAPSHDCAAAPGTELYSGYLPALATSRGTDVHPRFTVSVGTPSSGIDGCSIHVRGEVLDSGGRVVGQALLSTTIQTQRGASDSTYSGQIGTNRAGTGSGFGYSGFTAKDL